MSALVESLSKEIVLKSIGEMSERITMEELFDRIIYLYKIEKGMEQSRRGEGTSIDIIREKTKTWRKEKLS
jgi:hypothetical protein